MSQTSEGVQQPGHWASLMTAEQLAEFLHVPLGTIYQWRHRGDGPPALKVGRHLRFRPSDVDVWLDSQAAS